AEEQRRTDAEEEAVRAEAAAEAAAVEAASAPPPAPEPVAEAEPIILDADTLRQREMAEMRAIQEEERKVAEAAEARRKEEEAKRKEAEEARRRDIAALIAEARERFTALDAEGGDPERRRAEANAIRTGTLERIAALLDPMQRARFDALIDPRRAEAARTVWVPGPSNGAPMGVPVRLGIGDGSFTEVVGGDLRPGQDVITGIAPANRDDRRGPRLGF
ncbi:hypothetical protein MCW82_08605, partial [Azospirillum doebereinerae]|nr:hypothetical protein [Azospirillum doebereinerae]